MKKASLRQKLAFVLLLIYLPLLGSFYFYSRSIIGRMDTQLVEGYRESLSAFCKTAEDEWKEADRYLSTFWNRIQNEDLQDPVIFEALKEDAEANAAELLDNNPEVGAVFIGTREEEILLTGRLYDEQQTEFDNIIDQLKYDSGTRTINRGWVLYNEGTSPLLVRTFLSKDIFLSVVFDLQNLSESALRDYALSSPIVFQNGEEYITDAHWLKNYDGEIMSWNTKDYYKIKSDSSPYIVISRNLLGMNAVYAVPYTYDWNWLNYIIVVFLLVSVFAFLIVWMILNSEVFKPLNKLVYTMQNIEKGETGQRAVVYKNMEFSSINNTFNRMVDRLENQRIETYEAQINAKNFQMNALRLQIRRHFFLNCLKNIYSLTKTGNISDIQKTVLLLSKYLRYTLDISRNEIALSEELESCRNYMKLVEIGQDMKPELELRAEEDTLALPVPPISLLSLVENCNKYGQRQDQPLKIVITAEKRKLDEDAFLWLTVSDNGPGFTNEMLEKLNSEMNSVRRQGHVGINNVRDRIEALYGEECSMTFSNLGGANVEIVIPLKGGTENAAADS